MILKLWCIIGLMVGGATAATTPPLIPNAAMVNQEGKPFQVHDFKGQYLLITFIFSRCPQPNMCPLTMTKTKAVLRQWKEKNPKLPLHALAVTLDPDHDSASVLKKFGKAHSVNFKDFTLATGKPEILAQFASEFNVIGFPSEGTISHNLKSILVSPELVEIKQFKDNEWKNEDVVAAATATASN